MGNFLKKISYLQRHEKKFHDCSGEAPQQTSDKEGNCDEQWLEQDPGDLIGDVTSSSENNSSDSSEDEDSGVSDQIEKEKVTTNESKATDQKEKAKDTI